jgi:hypothetical protein
LEETGVPRENHRPVASHWQTLLQNDVSTTPRYEPGSPLCIVYVPNQKSVLRVSILPLSTIILVDLGNIPTVVFFVFHLFHIKLLPMYYRFLNSYLFFIEDTKKKQYVYLRGYRSQDKR